MEAEVIILSEIRDTERQIPHVLLISGNQKVNPTEETNEGVVNGTGEGGER